MLSDKELEKYFEESETASYIPRATTLDEVDVLTLSEEDVKLIGLTCPSFKEDILYVGMNMNDNIVEIMSLKQLDNDDIVYVSVLDKSWIDDGNTELVPQEYIIKKKLNKTDLLNLIKDLYERHPIIYANFDEYFEKYNFTKI